ncbi:MAG: cation-transporting P-type ATPase [Clostridia bacterium]|nr:cation-transporting P-type ATPase [Clostridia bacterium]
MAEKWYDKSIKQVEVALKTDVNHGLDEKEIRKRRSEDGENDVYGGSRKFGGYLRHIIFDYTSILMLVTLLIAAVFDERKNLFVMIGVLVTYYIIVIASYLRSERILRNVSEQGLPSVRVIRGGKLSVIHQREMVRGDVFLIATGDIIPCDARLCESSGLEILEAAVTGVMTASRKDARFVDFHDIPESERRNMAFASTVVTHGTGKAICCEVGADTAIRRKNGGKPPFRDEQDDVFVSVNDFCRKWTIFMTVWIFVLTAVDVFFGRGTGGIFDTFLLGVSSAVASMSEFYLAFAYISLACGVYAAVSRKGDVNRGALVNSTSRLNTLRNLTCLIVPKRHGFCASETEVGYVCANDDVFKPDDHGYKRNASRVLRYALLSTGLYGTDRLSRKNQTRDNVNTSEEECILNASREIGEYNVKLEENYPLLEHISRGRDSLFDTSLVRYGNGFVVALRGEYVKILPRCRYYCENGRVYDMDNEKMESLVSTARELTRMSYRVIAVASKDTTYNNLMRISASQTELTLEGMIAIKESVLPDAAKNISRCRSAGIKVIMLCDDDDESNLSFAASLGIATSASEIATSAELKGSKEALFRANAGLYSVYVGLSVYQKRQLVKYLQENGEKVGFLCSELDEIILMRDADIGFSRSVTISDSAVGTVEVGGIALNARNSQQTKETGCDALKFVSDVIVSDPDLKTGTGGFNAMVDAVLCGKSIYHNLHRMIRYMLSSQFAKIIIVLASIISRFTLLTPPQVLFCGLIVDFLALVVIAFEKPSYRLLETDVDRERLRHPIGKNPLAIFCGVIWAVLTVAVIYLMVRFRIISSVSVYTCTFLIFTVSQLTVLLEYKLERGYFGGDVRFNGAHLILILFVALFFTLAFLVPGIGAAFGVAPVQPAAIPGVVIVPVLIFAVCEIAKYVSGVRKRKKEDEQVKADARHI